jgi:hypothetical protein
MQPQPYIPGFSPVDTGPLSRFLPSLEDGVISTWLSTHASAGNWLLDPFGFSPRLALEAARSGHRVLVTANNPITRFLLEIFATPPSEAEFTAALADLGAIRKGDERLESHLRSLYLTQCEKCEAQIEAQAFLWHKGEDAPYARVYECRHCGDSGERTAREEDLERARRIAETDKLHRSRAFERVVSLNDEDRVYAEEAIQHYLPRPLYVLTTITNRLDGLNFSETRKRALTALTLLACDAGNTLWAHPAERPRPKQLSTPNQFREHNLWMMLENGLSLFSSTGADVPCVAWPNKLPETGGICMYEGRLRDLAHEVKKEIPIAAVIGSIPRPNQAFWTFSALWAGWLWGRDAVEPYKNALRRRRYDWAWSATALHAMFTHLNELLVDGVPVFHLMSEAEPPFMTAALTAAQTAGFSLESIALRTQHDPVQILWKSTQRTTPTEAGAEMIREAIYDFLSARGEPAGYLHVHTCGLIALAQANALKQTGAEFDETLRSINSLVELALTKDDRFVHYSTGEAVDTGTWGLKHEFQESLADRVEVAIVTFLQNNPDAIYIEIENDLYPQFPGLLTPSKGLIYAVLYSYAEKEGSSWKLRPEDVASVRRDEMNNMFDLLDVIGKRLNYQTRRDDKLLHWDEKGRRVCSFYVLASALVGRALENAGPETMIVLPGGRAALAAYKQQRDPSLVERLKGHQVVKYRMLRTLMNVPILTRETFDEQVASDPLEQSKGQLMMF